MVCFRYIIVNNLHKGNNKDNNNNNNNNIYGPKYTKNAVLCTTIPHFVRIWESFGMTDIIYSKPIRMDVK